MTTSALKEIKEDAKVPFSTSPKAGRNQVIYKNDVNPLRSTKMLDKLDLDLDSPRLKIAMDNLGISVSELKMM